MSIRSFLRTVLFLLILFMFSCSIKYFPIESKNITVSEGHAILNTKDYVFAVKNKYWVKDPQDLTDYFTTFYISFKNKTNKKVNINSSDINLLDETGNQYDVVLAEDVLNLLIPEEVAYEQFTTITQEEEQIYKEWRDAKNNLMSDTFNFGMVLSGAKKSGFIFFPKLPSNNKKCEIIFKDHSIEFDRTDKK